MTDLNKHVKIDREIEIITVKNMKVKCIDNENRVDIIQNKIYDVISIDGVFFRIIDESEEDYMYPSEMFEIIEKGEVILTEKLHSRSK